MHGAGYRNLFLSTASAYALMLSSPASAQDVPAAGQAAESASEEPEIIVTAQKRQQNINDVPMSITAATGDQLELAGIEQVADLPKITPGFSVGKNNVGTAVFTLRGVGYNDVSIAARPAVTVYIDEAPIPFAIETQGVGLDIERVEVLKGPQGTLFGNNSTGGAINYIARKPTDSFEAGGSFTYGRFNQADVEAYVSGPITDTLSARLAVEHESSGGWQKSLTRDDKLGRTDFTNGRLSLAWEPSADLRAQLTLSRWIDRSDMPAGQVILISPQIPDVVPLTGVPSIVLAPNNNRAADWDPNRDLEKNNTFFQASGRIDYDLSDRLTLTSLTNYIHFKLDYVQDSDGSAITNVLNPHLGTSKSFSQEVRLLARFDRVNSIAGAVYSHDRTDDDLLNEFSDSTTSYSFVSLGAPLWTSLGGRANQKTNTWAVFGNVEFDLTEQLTLHGGLRYTESKLTGLNCAIDVGDGNGAAALNAFLNALRAGASLPPVPPSAPGECASIAAPALIQAGNMTRLSEDNISWRAGIQYKPSDDILLYANASRGYKGGAISAFATIYTNSYIPVTQESVLAFEAGFKAELLDRALQINGAAFHSRYTDKQVLGNDADPILGTIARLVNIPKSRIYGAELQIVARPFEGLTLTGAGSYVKSEILGHFTDFNALQQLQDMHGTMLPYAPKWQLSGTALYRTPINDRIDAFFGANVSYQSESFSYLGEVPLVRVKPYTLTDLQAGIESGDRRWRAYVWGRNVFNTHYWTAAAKLIDTAVRWTGKPATYGVTLSYNFR